MLFEQNMYKLVNLFILTTNYKRQVDTMDTLGDILLDTHTNCIFHEIPHLAEDSVKQLMLQVKN